MLIKIGLDDIPALTFAGLRYGLAFLSLLPLAMQRGHLNRATLRRLTRRDWLWLVVLGVIFYTMTQGAQFLALVYLPAVTLSLLLNFTSVVVALLGIVLLDEWPTSRQWGGIALFLLGVGLYFYPVAIPAGEVLGLLIGVGGVLANAGASLLGRAVNRTATIPPLTVTTISMGVGAALLLGAGITAQGLPAFGLKGWLIVGWLALVNTAFAFTLWNVTLRTLSATESSVINNTMLVQIAVLAWLFLGEGITAPEGAGLVLAALGILVVQLGRRR